MQESLSTFLMIGAGPTCGRSDGSSPSRSRSVASRSVGMAWISLCRRALTSAPQARARSLSPAYRLFPKESVGWVSASLLG